MQIFYCLSIFQSVMTRKDRSLYILPDSKSPIICTENVNIWSKREVRLYCTVFPNTSEELIDYWFQDINNIFFFYEIDWTGIFYKNWERNHSCMNPTFTVNASFPVWSVILLQKVHNFIYFISIQSLLLYILSLSKNLHFCLCFCFSWKHLRHRHKVCHL